MGTVDLFANADLPVIHQSIGDQAVVLRGFVLGGAAELLVELENIHGAAPFRIMMTPGGKSMSVALTNCGSLGWVADRGGYRYTERDPRTGRRWPAMPPILLALAGAAAEAAGFKAFVPDACLVNRYLPGTRLSLHQDRDERDLSAPIVSVSLGLPAVFQFGGANRSDKPLRVPLQHGDAVVWGGVDRLRYHGVLPVPEGNHPVLGAQRINLTFRKAG